MTVGGGETATNVSGWSVDTALGFIDAVRTADRDYYEARLADADRRYEERFIAQKEAMEVAFAAQQSATQAAFLAAEKAVGAALAAAEKAVTKSEDAYEKRFDSVNEFRAQLADQTRTLLPRLEYDRAHTDLIERVDQMRQTFDQHLSSIDQTIIQMNARKSGGNEVWGYVGILVGLLIAVGGLVIGFAQ